MKFTALLCAALAFGGNVLALHLHPRSENAGKTLSFEFQKVKRNVDNIPRLRKRASTSTIRQLLDNLDYLYYANVSMGTPPQNLRLHLDTGSSDVWVETMKSRLCQQRSGPCRATGTFNPDNSSTYEQVSDDFDISYVDGEYARGDYGKDVFTLSGGAKVTGLQFGVGLDTTSTDGIMGIGFDLNEVQVQRLGKEPYRNLVDLMVDQKLIRSRAYSLWLNDLDASTGQVLFGGVDTAKFTGSLTTLPMDKRQGETQAREFAITLTSVSLTISGKSQALTAKGYASPVLLDTGSTYTYLDPSIAQALSDQVGAQPLDQYGVAVVPCQVRNVNASVIYGFSGAAITIPLSELVVDAKDNRGNPARYSDGTPLCYWGILSSGDVGTNVLGDTFLRSAYVVYDLDNQEISLGNTLFNVTDSTIREIGTGKSAVPDATGAASAVTAALASGTDTIRGNSPPIITGAVTGSPPSSPTGTKNTAPSLYPSFISMLLLFTTLFISLVL